MRAHALHAVLYALLAATAAVVATCIYWWFFDNKSPLTTTYVHPLPLTAPAKTREQAAAFETKIVRGGGTYWIYQEYCQEGGIPGEVQVHIVDTVVWPLRRTNNIGQRGCFERSFKFVVPPALPPGEYQRRVTIEYRRNPLRTVRVEPKPVYFHIEKEPER